MKHRFIVFKIAVENCTVKNVHLEKACTVLRYLTTSRIFADTTPQCFVKLFV